MSMPDKEPISNQSRKVTGLCLVYPRFWKQTAEDMSVRLSNFIQLIKPSVESMFVITDRDVEQELLSNKLIRDERVQFVGNVGCSDNKFILPRILGELAAQLQISRNLISISDNINIIFWRTLPSAFPIPLILAKLKGKKSILFVESRPSRSIKEMHKGPLGIEGFVLSQIWKVIERTAFSLSDMIVVNVPSLLCQPWLNKYKSKVFPLPVVARFINSDFKVSKPLSERRAIIGYVGRMSQEKGVVNLVEAMPSICNQISGVEFLLGGYGPLLEQVKRELTHLIPQNQVKVLGWIPYKELPGYLNEVKLLVVPSYIESGPYIVIEAMACGTPVLATPVGAVPDIIMDGKTGFIMEDNSPECIAENVLRALSYPKLDKIAKDAHDLVEKEYGYETMVERYKVILHQLTGTS